MDRMRWSHSGVLSQTEDLLSFQNNLTEITYRLQNYRKVLFVREPITRILSAYLSKHRSFGDRYAKYLGELHRQRDREKVSWIRSRRAVSGLRAQAVDEYYVVRVHSVYYRHRKRYCNARIKRSLATFARGIKPVSNPV